MQCLQGISRGLATAHVYAMADASAPAEQLVAPAVRGTRRARPMDAVPEMKERLCVGQHAVPAEKLFGDPCDKPNSAYCSRVTAKP